MKLTILAIIVVLIVALVVSYVHIETTVLTLMRRTALTEERVLQRLDALSTDFDVAIQRASSTNIAENAKKWTKAFETMKYAADHAEELFRR